MPRIIVKLEKNNYVDWSTVVDAPVTKSMTRKEALQYVGIGDEKRIERADKYGTSHLAERDGVGLFIKGNRAGEGEKELTLQEIIEICKK